MEDLRSKSCREGRMHEKKGTPSNMKDLRSYSHHVSYSSSVKQHQNHHQPNKEVIPKIKKLKTNNNNNNNNNNNIGSSEISNWSFKDPELQRKTRVAGYKVYAVEGKMKGSLRKSFKWIKNTYTQLIHGGWT